MQKNDSLFEKIDGAVDALAPSLDELSQYIYDHPELGFEEFKSSAAHIALLKEHGFAVEENYLDFPTAFRAVYDSGKPGLTVAYLPEYDALPGIGHGCGHNLLGTVETGAGIVLSKVIDEIGGRVVVLGTPAEETAGVKVDMAAADTFDDVDFAISTHPSDDNYTSQTSQALIPIEVTFHGKTAHAASAPEKGINALDALLLTFTNLNALRQQLPSTVRVHGIVKEGGKAANVIPDLTVGEFYVRAMTMPEVLDVKRRFIACIDGAATATGCTYELREYEKSYFNLITNRTLSSLFDDNMERLGRKVNKETRSTGSLDMGNVSQVVPTINPYYGITDGVTVPGHTVEFRECTLTDFGKGAGRDAIRAQVMTAIDVMREPALFEAIQKEFDAIERE